MRSYIEYTFYQPVFYFSQRFLADAENGDTAYHFKVHTVAQVVAPHWAHCRNVSGCFRNN